MHFYFYIFSLEKNEIYNEAGGIFVVRRGTLLQANSYEKVGHIDLDELSAWEIQSKISWDFARNIVNKKLYL